MTLPAFVETCDGSFEDIEGCSIAEFEWSYRNADTTNYHDQLENAIQWYKQVQQQIDACR